MLYSSGCNFYVTFDSRFIRATPLQMALSNYTFNVIGVMKESPWITSCSLANGGRKTDECRHPGLSVETITLLSKRLGFRYNTIWVDSHDQLESALANGQADFSLAFVAVSEERWQKFKFMQPMNFLSPGFMAKLPEPSIVPMPLLRPFDFYIWLCLLIIFFVLFFILTSALETSRFHYPGILFRLFAFTLRQRCSLSAVSGTWLKLLSTQYSLLLMLIGIMYGGSFIAFLCPVQKGHPFHDMGSLADLVAAGHRTLYVSGSNTLFFNMITKSALPGHVKMRKAISKHSPVLFKSTSEQIAGLLDDKRLVTPTTALSYSYMTRNIIDSCYLDFIQDNSVIESWESVIMRNDFPHARLFYRTFQRGLREMVWEIANRDYYFHFQHSRICSRPTARRDQATGLQPHLPVIQFWGAAMLISFMVFVLERSWSMCA